MKPGHELRKEALIKALVSKPTAPNKRLKPDPVQPSSTPLLDKENAEKARWAARLEAIGKRAGAAASSSLWKINRRISLRMIRRS